MLVEGSAVENPSDWSPTLESKNLTRRRMKDRAVDLVLYDRVWKRGPEAFHAVDADVARAVWWYSDSIVFFEEEDAGTQRGCSFCCCSSSYAATHYDDVTVGVHRTRMPRPSAALGLG